MVGGRKYNFFFCFPKNFKVVEKPVLVKFALGNNTSKVVPAFHWLITKTSLKPEVRSQTEK